LSAWLPTFSAFAGITLQAEIRRIVIKPYEFRKDTGWKVHPDGLLESPEGQTIFPSTHPQTGEEIGLHSYYLETEEV